MKRAPKSDLREVGRQILDAGEGTLREIGFPDGKKQDADRATDRMHATAVACALWSNPGSLLDTDPTLVRELAASLARFVLDEYAVAGRPSLKKVDQWISTEYRIRVHHFREKAEAAASDIAKAASQSGRRLSPERVKNIAAENAEMARWARHLIETHRSSPQSDASEAARDARLSWLAELNLMQHENPRQRPSSRKRR